MDWTNVIIKIRKYRFMNFGIIPSNVK